IIGIRKAHLAYTAGPCYPNCEHADFPSGNALIFSAGPQIRVEDIQGPTDAYAGIGFPVQFDLRNPGSRAAENFTLRYWVSPEPQITVDALSAGLDDRRWTLNPRDAVRVFAEPRLPIELEEGEYYLIVEADPEFMVPISNRASTLGVYGPFRVGIRAANLTVPWVEAPDLVKPGEVLNLRWLARTAGNLLANAIEYRVILELERFCSPAMTALPGGTVSDLGRSEELFMETSVRSPGEVEPGVYYLGVAINPSRDVYELQFRDNVGFSLPVVVAEDEP